MDKEKTSNAPKNNIVGLNPTEQKDNSIFKTKQYDKPPTNEETKSYGDLLQVNKTNPQNNPNESNQLKEKTYNEKIKQLQHDLEKEREINKQFKQTHQKIVEEKNKDLKDKEKSYQSISVTNTKLMQTLEDLRKEVDEQFDKMSIKGLNKLKKKEENKQNPLDIVLKVKDKELKNATQLIEILRKDNEQLNKNLENYSEFKNVLDLQDKLKVKERENASLQQEIKLLNRSLEEHKKCSQIKASLENEVKTVKEEYRILKDSVKTQQSKKSEDEKTHHKLVEQYFTLKKEFEKMKNSANVKDIKDTQAIDKLLNQAEKKKVKNFNHDSGVLEVLNSEDVETPRRNLQKKTEKNSKSGTVIQKSKKNLTEEEKQKLFSLEERAKLEKVFSKADLDKLEKKYDVMEYSKHSVQNKHKSDLKVFTRKFSEQEEKLEFMNLQLKEVDQKYKINQFQINEYKNEHRAYQRKILELQGQMDTFNSNLKEKEQENKILMNQLNSLRKIVKHNALPPMDSELAKHLEKIKSEESNLNSFNNELNDLLKGGNESNHREENFEPEEEAEMNLEN